MRARGRLVASIAVVATALVLPAAAWAHAALLRTVPEASGTVNHSPPQVRLTFSEAVEPRFAIVSVTDAAGHQQTSGPPHRSTVDPHELDVPLDHLAEGWYLVYWRVISADGHPVRSAFTFAVGPNPGPAPQFVIPSITETAATTELVIARWAAFLSIMAALGLFVFRALIARPLGYRVDGARLRPLSVGFWVTFGIACVITPVYVLLSTAKFALRSFWDVNALLPLMRDSSFGRSWLDLELVLLLFGLCAAAALWVDRSDRPQRSIASLLAIIGGIGSAAAVLIVPAIAGHASQTSPRGLALAFDWLHLATGSIWLGGLIGILLLWVCLPATRRIAGVAVCVPRFSNVAFVSVLALIASGIGSTVLHFPTLSSLWQTAYGQSLLVKIALLAAALLLGAVNMLRTKPRLQAKGVDRSVPEGAATLLRRLVSVELVLVTGAIVAAAVLTSLPPPPKALASLGRASAHVGPGPVTRVVVQNGYQLHFKFDPNQAAVPNMFEVRITRDGKPVRGTDVTATFTMLDMEMGTQAYHLAESAPGVYRHSAPALVMVGHWGVTFDIRPEGKAPFTVLFVDKASG